MIIGIVECPLVHGLSVREDIKKLNMPRITTCVEIISRSKIKFRVRLHTFNTCNFSRTLGFDGKLLFVRSTVLGTFALVFVSIECAILLMTVSLKRTSLFCDRNFKKSVFLPSAAVPSGDGICRVP